MEVQFAIFDILDDFIEIDAHAFILGLLQEVHLLQQFEVRHALGVQYLLEVTQFGVVIEHPPFAAAAAAPPRRPHLVSLHLLLQQLALEMLGFHP